jgi:N6-adenosine-specific RNA methylase IME4
MGGVVEPADVQLRIVGLSDPVESYEEAVQAWHHLDGLQDDLNWTRGALVSLVVVKWGEGTLEDYAKKVGRSVSAIWQYRRVFDVYQNSTRVQFLTLKWVHFRSALALDEPERTEALRLAEKNGWAKRDLELHIRRARAILAPLPDGKYRVIYADPPWEYPREQHSREEQETTLSSHYQSLSLEKLCAMPVKDIAQDDAVLFLWTTSPKLEESFEVIKAWGFTYKTSMVWDKIKHNVGYYVSVRHEFLLISTRGSCTPDVPDLHDSVVSIERGEHSEKPDYFRELIDKMYPDGRRIELFARKPSQGWEVYGNDERLAVG